MTFPTSSHVHVRELILHFMLTIAMWIASFTFLLPALFFLKGKSLSKFTKMFLSEKICVDLPKRTRTNLEPLKKKLFDLVEDHLPNYRQKQLNILDLSLEFRYNFKFYNPENHQVVVMAKDSEAKSDYLGKIGKPKNKGRLKPVICENLYELLSESCDIVISTLRLCSVEDTDAVFREIKRILKPGGVFGFMEHVGFPEEQIAYAIQRMASPLWRTYFSGCHLNTHVIKKLKRAGFSTISYTTYYPEEQLMYVRPTVLGICVR